ncbi:hypothetical protein LXA43DRAFT_1097482 [Ganoderma leucocontextum]|nr:hypothetical protein LXA43DRAFT_1097482 [Ganoderma leucocontextum]
MKASDLITAFATIPMSRWPLRMRDDKGNFPPCSDAIYCTPMATNIFAEVFIATILPVVPAGEIEQFAESAFFRGVIEVFSIPAIYPWVLEHGHYDQLLIDEPSPYPYDCTHLGERASELDQEKELRNWVHAYAVNTRHRLEGRDSSAPTASFSSRPSLASDIIKDAHIPLISSHESLFDTPQCSYDNTDVPSRTALPPSAESSALTTPSSEDINMSPNHATT